MKEQTAKAVKAAKSVKEPKVSEKKTKTVSKKVKTEKTFQTKAAPSAVNKKKPFLCIDYPLENESINVSYHYALRIGASNDGYVEVSFNGGEWNPCRYSAGYWWFDIMYFKTGKYLLRARMADSNGNIVVETEKRMFSIC